MRALFPLLLLSPLCAQTVATIPEAFERVPGNFALSMPGRWSVGIMQTVINKAMIPAGLKNATVSRVRLRRSNFLGTGAAPAKTIQLTLQMGPSAFAANKMWGEVEKNYGTGMVYVVGASGQGATYSIPALPAPGRGDALGAALIDLPLSVPYVFADQNTLIEWETMAGTFDVTDPHWIDAVSNPGGVVAGAAVSVGHGGCGPSGAAIPMALDATPGSRWPKWGSSTQVELEGGAPGQDLILNVELDPLANATALAWGGTFGSIGQPSCHVWAGIGLNLIVLPSKTNFLGGATVSVPFPASPGPSFLGKRVGLQALMVQPSFAASNGVVLMMNQIDVGADVSTIIIPGTHYPDYLRPLINPKTMASDPINAPWGRLDGVSPVFEFL